MGIELKPIMEYTESEIVNVYPEYIQDSYHYLSNLISSTESVSELECLIHNVYQEGYKDGLALAIWLEKGIEV